MRKSKEQCFIEDLYPGDSEAWPHYVKTTVAFNEAVRERCLQELAERCADMNAEHDDPALYRYHAACAVCLQAQIDNNTRIIQRLLALPPGPKWIDAEKPRRLKRPTRRAVRPVE